MKPTRMSRILLLVALNAGASLIVAAEVPESLPPRPSYVKATPMSLEQASFRLYVDVASMENTKSGAGKEFLRKSMGLDEAVSARYTQYMQSAVLAYNRGNGQAYRGLCSRLQGIVTAEQAIDAISLIDQASEAHKAQLVRASEGVLGAADNIVSELVIRQTIAKSAKVSQVDLLEFVRTTGNKEFPLERLSAFCVRLGNLTAQPTNSQ